MCFGALFRGRVRGTRCKSVLLYVINVWPTINGKEHTFLARCLKSSVFVIFPNLQSGFLYTLRWWTITLAMLSRKLSLILRPGSLDVSASHLLVLLRFFDFFCFWRSFSFAFFWRSFSLRARIFLLSSFSGISSSVRGWNTNVFNNLSHYS